MKYIFNTMVNCAAIVLMFCYIDMKIGGIDALIDYLDNEICEIKKKYSE